MSRGREQEVRSGGFGRRLQLSELPDFTKPDVFDLPAGIVVDVTVQYAQSVDVPFRPSGFYKDLILSNPVTVQYSGGPRRDNKNIPSPLIATFTPSSEDADRLREKRDKDWEDFRASPGYFIGIPMKPTEEYDKVKAQQSEDLRKIQEIERELARQFVQRELIGNDPEIDITTVEKVFIQAKISEQRSLGNNS